MRQRAQGVQGAVDATANSGALAGRANVHDSDTLFKGTMRGLFGRIGNDDEHGRKAHVRPCACATTSTSRFVCQHSVARPGRPDGLQFLQLQQLELINSTFHFGDHFLLKKKSCDIIRSKFPAQ